LLPALDDIFTLFVFVLVSSAEVIEIDCNCYEKECNNWFYLLMSLLFHIHFV